MSKKDVVGGSSITASQMKDFWRQVGDGSVNKENLQLFLEHRNPFPTGIKEDLGQPEVVWSTEWQRTEWGILYQEIGIVIDVASLKIPERPKGFDRLIVVAEGMSANRAFGECVKRFKCWRNNHEYDKAITDSNRFRSKGGYAVWVRDRVEADEELKNKSACDLKEEGILGMTVTQRFLYELKYFKEVRKHLDLECRTLCTGSRYLDGGVPRVGWTDDGLTVNWAYEGDPSPISRAREVSI